MRKSRRAICRLHDCSVALGSRATIRALVGGTFSRAERKGAWPHPASPRKPAEQFAMAYTHDRRRNFRRANRVAIRGGLSPRGHRRAADAFLQIISQIDNAAAPSCMKMVAS